MGKKRGVCLQVRLALLLAAACLSGCSGASDPEPTVSESETQGEQTWYFTYADNQPDDYPTTLAANYFAGLVETSSGGRIHITVEANGALGDEESTVRQLTYGGIDFARASIPTLEKYVPEIGVLMLPYLYRDSSHMWKVLDGEIGTEFMEDLDGAGIHALAWYDAGARSLYTCDAPVRTPEDLEGLRIRVQDSDLLEDFVKSLGATPVTSVYAEVYELFERDWIDGAENNLPSYAAEKHYRFAPYYTLDEHSRIPELQLVSEETWNQLSKEDQELIARCAQTSAVYERELWHQYEEQALAQVTEAGCQVISLSLEERMRFWERTKPLYDAYFPDQEELISKIRDTP
ncbi:MAG: TRAP transporter substrate-binding protein [Clostridiales bacterium]|nr:TRAP transporter substrate-binding protein [Clostridiales bacterium]